MTRMQYGKKFEKKWKMDRIKFEKPLFFYGAQLVGLLWSLIVFDPYYNPIRNNIVTVF